MMNTQKLSPQGYNINEDPMNKNPFWGEEEGGGGNVPAGGLTGQVLTKKSNEDFDTEWKTPESGGADWPSGGADGDILVKQGSGATWETPSFPTDEQIQRLTADLQETKAGLASEISDREAADTALGERIDVTSQEINDYKTVTNQSIAELRQAISDEASTREAADEAVNASVNEVSTDLSQYKQTNDGRLNTLEATDTRLEGLIDSEATARIDADALIRQDLTEAIQYETSQREAADNALRALIADNSGDIEVQEGAISALDQRVTANENGISRLNTKVNSIEPAVNQAVNDASDAKQKADALENIVDDILPKPLASDSAPYAGTSTDYVVPAYSQGRMLVVYTLNRSTKEYTKSLIPATILNYNPAGGEQAGILYLSAARDSNTSMATWGTMGGLTTSTQPSGSANGYAYQGSLLAYKFNGDKTRNRFANNAEWTNPVCGGTVGQVLTKKSNANYDWEWADPPAGGDTSALEARVETLEGDVAALETSVGNAESDIAELQGKVAGISTLSPYTTGLVKPTISQILMMPFLVVDPDSGEIKVVDGSTYGVDASTLAIPNSLASALKTAARAQGMGITPVYYPNAAVTFKNTTYGDTSGNLYCALAVGPSFESNPANTFPRITYTAPANAVFKALYSFSLATPSGSTIPFKAIVDFTNLGEITVTPFYYPGTLNNATIPHAGFNGPAGYVLTRKSGTTIESQFFFMNRLSRFFEDWNSTKNIFLWNFEFSSLYMIGG